MDQLLFIMFFKTMEIGIFQAFIKVQLTCFPNQVKTLSNGFMKLRYLLGHLLILFGNVFMIKNASTFYTLCLPWIPWLFSFSQVIHTIMSQAVYVCRTLCLLPAFLYSYGHLSFLKRLSNYVWSEVNVQFIISAANLQGSPYFLMHYMKTLHY